MSHIHSLHLRSFHVEGAMDRGEGSREVGCCVLCVRQHWVLGTHMGCLSRPVGSKTLPSMVASKLSLERQISVRSGEGDIEVLSSAKCLLGTPGCWAPAETWDAGGKEARSSDSGWRDRQEMIKT